MNAVRLFDETLCIGPREGEVPPCISPSDANRADCQRIRTMDMEQNDVPHHAGPPCRGVIWVFMCFVLALVVEEEFLGYAREYEARATINHEQELTSRTRLGPQPMPSVLCAERS